jgi:hypothetical protein
MKTKYVIQFRSGPLKPQFVGRWSEHGWVFTTEHLIANAYQFDSLTTCNLIRMLLDIADDTVTVLVRARGNLNEQENLLSINGNEGRSPRKGGTVNERARFR